MIIAQARVAGHELLGVVLRRERYLLGNGYFHLCHVGAQALRYGVALIEHPGCVGQLALGFDVLTLVLVAVAFCTMAVVVEVAVNLDVVVAQLRIVLKVITDVNGSRDILFRPTQCPSY